MRIVVVDDGVQSADVAGLDDKSSVRVAGVRVGKVDGIRLLPNGTAVARLVFVNTPLTLNTNRWYWWRTGVVVVMIAALAKPTATVAARLTARIKKSVMFLALAMMYAPGPCVRSTDRSVLRTISSTNTNAHSTRALMLSILPSWLRRFCSGVLSSSISLSMPAVTGIAEEAACGRASAGILSSCR